MILKYINNIGRALIIVGALYGLLHSASLKSQVSHKNNYTDFSGKENNFEIGNGHFLLNGEKFIVKAAELHYPRIPKEYWNQRIQMSKSLGMNTVCLYTFWNVHETEEGVFDFEGQNNIREFINLCKANGLYVILRPGPYVCAEWEMGGLPWWLLKKKDIRLRDNDPYFLEKVKIFEEALAAQIKDLTVENGGPIIMIQVENEYGAYGENIPYVSQIRNMLRKLYGEKIVMFQCDWSSNFILNGLDDLVWTMNFGTGADIEEQFNLLRQLRPKTPLMCSEFWSGWFDKWGAAHETRPADEMIQGIEEMLTKDISFSLYMTHGGTNWGHWAGANSPGYAPDVTSYDYDAPINESGNPTKKFWLLRETLQKFSPDSLPDLPSLVKPIAVDSFYFSEVAPLWDNLPQPIESEWVRTMEEFNQGFGSIMYVTKLPELPEGTVLHIEDVHDYGQIFINGNFIGKLDRRLGENKLTLPKCNKDDILEILVEAMGRINFGVAIKDFKGITEKVYYTLIFEDTDIGGLLGNWSVYLLPDKLDFYKSMQFRSVDHFAKNQEGRYPRGVYKAIFNVDDPSDTFLLFDSWGKGLVYLNGHPLGRIWDLGPQQTLYTPGPWLKEGENELLVFDIIGPKKYVSQGLVFPIIDKLQGASLTKNRKEGEYLDLGNLSPLFGGAFPQGSGWKRQMFKKPEKGKYLIVEAISPFAGKSISIAELYVLNEKGEKISREPWTVYYADSEDIDTGNNTADKVFDLQESTYWKTEETSGFPQRLVINLGREEVVGGFEYLPRVEYGAPGAIQDYRIYLTSQPPKK